ncbi:hypothetical protein IWW38_002882, partial [Coemansia aciculifera]
MSYIPKPDAWAARLDNTRSRGTHRRQSSIVILGSSDLGAPSPAVAIDDNANGRHRSVSGGTPKAPLAFVEAGTVLQEADFRQKRAPSSDARPSSAWRKLELPKLQLSWPMVTSRRRSTVSVVPQLETRLWTPEETSLLAHASLRFWVGGRTADLALVARDLRRSVRDVQTMLQLMLQEYVLYAHKAHWSGEEESVIRQWAAAEFPKCSTLNAAGAIRQSPSGLVGASNCLSLLRCRPPSRRDATVLEALYQSAPAIIVDGSELPAQVESDKQSDSENRDKKDIATVIRQLPAVPPSRQDPELRPNKPLFSFTAPMPIQDTSRPETKPTSADPVATVASRKDVNVLSKNTRSRRLYELPIRRPNASTVAKAEVVRTKQTTPSTATATTTEAACDLNDAELSPEQSTDTHDFNRLDGDIDLRFFDVPAAARKVIRGFVDGYIEKFFDVFFYRAIQCNFDGRGLCTETASTDLKLADATEREMLCFDKVAQTGIDLDRCSRHFHACLLRAVQRVNIYATDANWPSADAYATAVYNRAIEDTHYLALEGRMEAVEGMAAPGPVAAQRAWFESVGLRINQFKRFHYMSRIAGWLATKYTQGSGQRVFKERVRKFGYRA